MLLGRACKWMGLAVVLAWGATAVAQSQATLSAERDRLARMEQALENHMVEAEDYENELLGYDYKLGEAREALQQARDNYEQTRIELTRAERVHQRDADRDSERQLRKAKHAFAMARRGVDSRSRRVDILETSYDELQVQLQQVQQAVARSRERIASQEQRVEQLVAAMLQKASSRREQARASRQPPATPAVSQAAASAGTTASQGAAGQGAAPQAQQEAQQVQQEPQAVASAKPATGSTGVVQPGREALDDLEREMLQYAQRERERLQELLKEQGKGEGRQTFNSLVLTSSRGDSYEMQFLGHDQYRLVAPVEPGLQTFELSGFSTLKFRRTIPAEDAGKDYVFVVDARRLSRPRLVMYPQYLLSYLED